MIPKIIHYCWFGRGEKLNLVKKCIESWKKHCPDYQIIEWNEDNYDLASAPLFVRQAIEAKKWAFASDYIRYYVVYEHGGCYFDTDVEIIKSLDSFLLDSAFFGLEKVERYKIASGLGFGAEKGNNLLRELMELYEGIPFVDENGMEDRTPCSNREYPIFKKHGLRTDGTEQRLDDQTHIYPIDYFSPLDYRTCRLKRTKNTVAIHWYMLSWLSKEKRFLRRVRLNRLLYLVRNLLGEKRYEKLKKLLGKG